jgi:hypothetical protein
LNPATGGSPLVSAPMADPLARERLLAPST